MAAGCANGTYKMHHNLPPHKVKAISIFNTSLKLNDTERFSFNPSAIEGNI